MEGRAGRALLWQEKGGGPVCQECSASNNPTSVTVHKHLEGDGVAIAAQERAAAVVAAAVAAALQRTHVTASVRAKQACWQSVNSPSRAIPHHL